MIDLINETERIFSDCSDLAKRVLNTQGLTVLYIINLCDKKYITDGVLLPLSIHEKAEINRSSITSVLASLPLSECKDTDEIADKLLSGNAVIFGNDEKGMFCFAADAKSEDGRSISEPESEAVVRGPLWST